MLVKGVIERIGTGGGGVSSLNGLTGAIDIASAGNDIVITQPDADTINLEVANNLKFSGVGLTIDGGGEAITTGLKGYVTIPYTGTITGWTLLADQTGSMVVDVWKDTYANFPPTIADTITGSEKPTISAGVKGQDNALSTWTTSVSAGDVFAFNVDSCSAITMANLIIQITRS